MTVQRYILVFAGLFIMISLALGVEGSPLFVSKLALAFTAFVGGNLFQSGFTNFCPLGIILKKLGEEATEVIIAAKNPDKQAVIYEMADLWFHSLILLSALDLKPADILTELERRFGESGLKEKQNRQKKQV